MAQNPSTIFTPYDPKIQVLDSIKKLSKSDKDKKEKAIQTLSSILASDPHRAKTMFKKSILTPLFGTIMDEKYSSIHIPATNLLQSLATAAEVKNPTTTLPAQDIFLAICRCDNKYAAASAFRALASFIANRKAGSCSSSGSCSCPFGKTFAELLPSRLRECSKDEDAEEMVGIMTNLAKILDSIGDEQRKMLKEPIEKAVKSKCASVACFAEGILDKFYGSNKSEQLSLTMLDKLPMRHFNPSNYKFDGNIVTRTAPSSYEFFLINVPFSKGIVQCKWKIHKLNGHTQFGIADADATLPSSPCSLGDPPFRASGGKYLGHANFWVTGKCVSGERVGKSGDEVMMEVNLDASPRTWHIFVNGIQLTDSMKDIPKKIVFGVNLHDSGTSLELLSIKTVDKPEVQPKDGDKLLPWTA